MKLRRVILPDGTKKLEVIPPSPEEIEKRKKLIELRKERNKEYRDYINKVPQEIRYEIRFKEKVGKPDNNNCMNWLGSINSHGYGNTWYNGKVVGSHIVAYILAYGKIPKDKWVLHKCDNKRCVNKDHLFLGSRQDNINDMINKYGSEKISNYGEKNGNSKLTEKDIDEIRNIYVTDKMSMDKIAENYNVSKTNISDIINNKIWKDDSYTSIVRNNAGENHPFAKLTQEKITEIRKLYNNGEYSQNKLAEMFNVHRWTIQHVINNRTWKDNNHIPLDRNEINIKYYTKGENHHLSVLTQEQANEIREKYKRGKIRQIDLAMQYNVSRGTINRVVNNKRYENKEE